MFKPRGAKYQLHHILTVYALVFLLVNITNLKGYGEE